MHCRHLHGFDAVSERMGYTDGGNTPAEFQESLSSLLHNHWLICNVFKAETGLLALKLFFFVLCDICMTEMRLTLLSAIYCGIVRPKHIRDLDTD